jgi:hypothetical protein
MFLFAPIHACTALLYAQSPIRVACLDSSAMRERVVAKNKRIILSDVRAVAARSPHISPLEIFGMKLVTQ